MSASCGTNDFRKEGNFLKYLTRLSRCEFRVKIVVMLVLAVLLVVTFLDVTPAFLKVIGGGASVLVTALLGTVKI